MARSRKKVPGWCGTDRFMKRYANKTVRQFKGDLPNGKRYKRLFCSWNVCDWRYLFLRPSSKRRLHRDYDRPWQAWSK